MRKLALFAATMSLALPCLAGETLRVMTFNVRMPSPNDGPNRWEFRRDLLVDTIREKAPDVFGTQELFQHQGEYIASKLPGYAWFGLSRRGNHDDEHMGVFYRKDKLKLAASGDFWLSETPEQPGSMSWNVSLPRMVTWGLFETAGGKRFYFFNTHFPHRAEDAGARRECARVIMERFRKLPGGVPFIMTGDFNAEAGGDVYGVFSGAMLDAWSTAARRTGPEGTSSGFAGRTTGRRIDWILYRGAPSAVEAETVVRNDGGRFPSDHFPVFAILELR